MNKTNVIKAISCGAVPWRNRENGIEVLLIKQFAHKNKWGIPKGHIIEGETLEECAIREVREEAGIVVILNEKLITVQTTNNNEEKTVHSWLAEPENSDNEPNIMDPDCEVADAKWFKIVELPIIHMYQRPVIEHAVKILKIKHDIF